MRCNYHLVQFLIFNLYTIHAIFGGWSIFLFIPMVDDNVGNVCTYTQSLHSLSSISQYVRSQYMCVLYIVYTLYYFVVFCSRRILLESALLCIYVCYVLCYSLFH